MKDAEVMGSGLLVSEQEPRSDGSESDRIKNKLDATMAEDRTERAKYDKLLIAQIELSAKVSESEAKLAEIANKKTSYLTQLTELAKRSGKGKSK